MTPATATATKNRAGTATSGRPQPWLALDLSERTYYRRKAAGTLDAPPPPEQHAAHVAAKADRYFADQCRRLGPVEPGADHAPRRASPSRSRLDREFRRIAAT